MTSSRLNRLIIAISCIVVLSFPIFVAGCGDDDDDDVVPPPPDDDDDDDDVVPPPPAEPQVSFKNDIFPIFQANCIFAGCHGANPPSGLLLTTFDNFKKGGNGGAPFVPNDSKNSLIVKRITGVIQPQMPLGRAPLNQKDIDAIKTWIDNGAENN